MPEKVLITGGSGVIGSRLTSHMIDRGWQVVHLGRHSRSGPVQTFRWDLRTGRIDEKAFDGVTKIVHLAGASIAGRRWTESYKKEILDSRLQSARMLYNYLQSRKGSIDKLVSASAIGIYGAGGSQEVFVEERAAGSGFLADVVKQWEGEVRRIEMLGIPVAIVRTGIVLSNKGGALPKMALPVRLGVGAPLGSGKQIVSWVHIDDLCGVYMHLLETNLRGPFNATAPHPVSNKVLTQAIASQLRRPLWLPNVPELVLKSLLGEMADAVLTGANVSSRKIVAAGYNFKYGEAVLALKDLL
jgi:uncharacterized protein (TIGR01777 family)